MLNARLEASATIEPTDFNHLITLALLALETSEHPIAKNSHLTVEQLQKLNGLIYSNEYSDIMPSEVQITVKHVNAETERQAMLHEHYLSKSE